LHNNFNLCERLYAVNVNLELEHVIPKISNSVYGTPNFFHVFSNTFRNGLRYSRPGLAYDYYGGYGYSVAPFAHLGGYGAYGSPYTLHITDCPDTDLARSPLMMSSLMELKALTTLHITLVWRRTQQEVR